MFDSSLVRGSVKRLEGIGGGVGGSPGVSPSGVSAKIMPCGGAVASLAPGRDDATDSMSLVVVVLTAVVVVVVDGSGVFGMSTNDSSTTSSSI